MSHPEDVYEDGKLVWAVRPCRGEDCGVLVESEVGPGFGDLEDWWCIHCWRWEDERRLKAEIKYLRAWKDWARWHYDATNPSVDPYPNMDPHSPEPTEPDYKNLPKR